MNSKTKTLFLWTSIVLLFALFFLAGLGKLSGSAKENFIIWGYGTSFMYTIGVLEILGAIGLLIRKLREWASIGLIGIMIGAASIHFIHSQYSMIFLNVFAIILLGGIIRISSREW